MTKGLGEAALAPDRQLLLSGDYMTTTTLTCQVPVLAQPRHRQVLASPAGLATKGEFALAWQLALDVIQRLPDLRKGASHLPEVICWQVIGRCSCCLRENSGLVRIGYTTSARNRSASRKNGDMLHLLLLC